MSELQDAYRDEEENDKLNQSADGGAGPLWRADWNGDQGEIQTGGLPDSFNPHDFSEVLQHLGYAPDEIRMELVASTRWEQRTAKRDARGWKTGEYETVWLNAYRYRAYKNALCVNLPALYAEMKASTPSKHVPPSGDATAIVCWADIQTGKVDHLGGLKELLERLEAKRTKLAEYLTMSGVDHVVVADVGDIVEGFENVASQRYTNCLSLQDQIDVAATEFWKTIKLCEGFGKVDVLSIPSNHCQWRKKKELLGKPNDDWGLFISKDLEKLNREAGLAVSFHRPADDWDETLMFDIRGIRLGLAHGHQATNPDKVKDWWAKMTHGGVLDCSVLLTGHFHFPSLRPSGKLIDGTSKWHIQASTLDNGSSWVRNKMGEDGYPALTVFCITDEGFDPHSFALL